MESRSKRTSSTTRRTSEKFTSGAWELMAKSLIHRFLASILAPLFSSLVLLAALLTGTTSGQTGPHMGGTLIWGISSDPGGLDPNPLPSSIAQIQLDHAYENLVQRDWGYEKIKPGTLPLPILPKLAASWEWRGGDLVYHIREGVKFHDGTPLNAQAVEFNFRRWWDKKFPYYYAPAAVSPGFTSGFIKNVKALDDHTFSVSLGERNWPFFDFMGEQTFWAIVSPAAIKKYGNPQIAKSPAAAAGTGPYRIAEYEPGKRLVMERFKGYWGQQPYLDRIIFRPIPDTSARVAALLTGEVQIIDEVDPDLMDKVRTGQGVTLALPGKPNAFSLLPKVTEPPFSDRRVRHAVSIAIDRAAIARDLLHGSALPARGQLGIGNAAYNPNLPVPEYNPGEAKKLLAEAGYPNGFRIKTRVPGPGCGMPKTVEVMEAVQSYLRAVGIELELEPMDWVQYVSWWASQGVPKGSPYAMAPMCTGFGTPYVLAWYNASYSTPPHGVNIRFYSNPKLDAIFIDADRASAYDQFVRMYRDVAQPIVYNDDAVIPIFYGLNPYGVSNKVKGWTPNTAWAQLLTRAWLAP